MVFVLLFSYHHPRRKLALELEGEKAPVKVKANEVRGRGLPQFRVARPAWRVLLLWRSCAAAWALPTPRPTPGAPNAMASWTDFPCMPAPALRAVSAHSDTMPCVTCWPHGLIAPASSRKSRSQASFSHSGLTRLASPSAGLLIFSCPLCPGALLQLTWPSRPLSGRSPLHRQVSRRRQPPPSMQQ